MNRAEIIKKLFQLPAFCFGLMATCLGFVLLAFGLNPAIEGSNQAGLLNILKSILIMLAALTAYCTARRLFVYMNWRRGSEKVCSSCAGLLIKTGAGDHQRTCLDCGGKSQLLN